MHVYLWFEDTAGQDTSRYLLKRMVRPRREIGRASNSTQIEVDLELARNGQRVYNPEETIASILPIMASQFFMFHGEDLRYMSQEHLEHTKRAIELILEAETFRQGTRDLKRIGEQVEKEHDDEIQKVEDLAQLVKSKDHFAQKIETNEKDLGEAKKELEKTKKTLNEIEDELRTREKSKASMARLDDLRKQKSQIEDDQRKLLSRRDGLINQLPTFVILPELVNILDKKHEKHKIREEILEKIQQLKGRLDLAKEVSKLKACICGHDITQVERKFIQKQQEKTGKLITELTSQLVEEDPTYYELRETIKGVRSSNPDIETLEKDMADLRIRKDEVDSATKSIERQLSGSEEEKIRELNTEKDDLRRKEGEIEERIRNIEKSKKENEEHKETCIRLIKQREKAYSISTSLDGQYDLTKRCYDAFDFVLAKLSGLRKSQIMEYSTQFFNKLTNKPEEYTRIDIDDNYNVRVVDSKGNIIFRPGLSTAEREIVALSFILGLKNASEKIAPLVLDTFFVHLDESHYSNIVSALPSFSDQTILILTDLEYKNLKERASESFFESVNQIWKINRIRGEERSEPKLTKEMSIHE